MLILFACNHDKESSNPDCIIPTIVPQPSYSNPVWYSDGNRLGFNRLPVRDSFVNGTPPCTYTTYSYYEDSAGFWIINKDGTNLRRLTTFQLDAPAWSHNGKWIAFCNGGIIYKMPFDGNNFDTTRITALTPNDGSNRFYAAWNLTDDTLFFDSNKDTPVGTDFYHIWKMESNGGDETLVTKTLTDGEVREPFCINNNLILHTRYIGKFIELFTMDANGNNVKQITTDTLNIYNSIIRNPRYYNNKDFYEAGGIWATNMDGTGIQELAKYSTQGFSISNSGIIAYVNYDYVHLGKIDGTVWLINADGTNQYQLTFNFF